MTDTHTPPTELFSVAGRSVVVTGGSRGIGAMIARGFLAGGARVLISARKEGPLSATAEELSELGECHAVPADLSTMEGVEALAAEASAWAPALDVLVNNAGATWGEPIETYPEAGWDKVMDTNVKGVFYLTTRLLPQLRAAASAERPARVIAVGSVDGLRAPLLESYAYSASKAAVHMLVRHLAKRLAPEHITVNAIAPGPFPSKMMAFALEDPEARAVVEERVPLGRIGRPDDAAGAALFLASPAASYITGAVLPLDGGIVGAGS